MMNPSEGMALAQGRYIELFVRHWKAEIDRPGILPARGVEVFRLHAELPQGILHCDHVVDVD
jgi:hypothetical protein